MIGTTEISSDQRTPRARNLKEVNFFISLETCLGCGARLDVDLFWLSAETETAASMTGKCNACKKGMGISFLGGNLLKAPWGNLDEIGIGRTEILVPWKLAAEIDLLSPKVQDDPTLLDIEHWKINRDTNKRVIMCANELFKLLDDGHNTIADSLLSAEDQQYREHHPHGFTREWISQILKRHKNVSQAILNDLPRIDQLEKERPKRKRRKK